MATPDETGALLQKIAGGCCLSFDRIYRRTSRHLLAVILRLNGHRGESEELLQETFLKVWKESWRFDPLRSTGNTWLTVLARNTALDSLRRRHARPKFNAAADAETSEPDVLGHVESPSRPAAESFDAKALSFHIASSLRELDP
jgi:RNA polymerase sigma factor (sigma-70 family)